MNAAAPMGTNFEMPLESTPGVKKKFEELHESGAQFFSSMSAKVQEIDAQELLLRFLEALGRLINWIKQACLALLGVHRKPQGADDMPHVSTPALSVAPPAPLHAPGTSTPSGFQFGHAPQAVSVPVAEQWEDTNKSKPGFRFEPSQRPDTGVEDVIFKEHEEPAHTRPQLGKPVYLLGADAAAPVEEAATLAALDVVQKQLQSPQAGQVVADLLGQGRVFDAVNVLFAPAADAFSQQAAEIRASLAQDLDHMLRAEIPDAALRHAGIHEVLASLPTLSPHATFSDDIQARIATHLQTRLSDVHQLVLYRVAQGGLSNLLVGFHDEAPPVQAPPQLHTRFTFHRDASAEQDAHVDAGDAARPKA